MNSKTLFSCMLLAISCNTYSHPDHEKSHLHKYDLSSISGISAHVYMIPDEFHPYYHGNEEFTFYLNFPTPSLPLNKVGPTPSNSLRIRVKHDDLRAGYSSKNTKRDGTHIKKENGFDVYKEYIGKIGRTEVTIYLIKLKNDQVMISQAGGLNLRAYRSAGRNRELDYVYSNQLTMQEWLILDQYIMKVLQSFMAPPNKSLNQNGAKDAPPG